MIRRKVIFKVSHFYASMISDLPDSHATSVQFIGGEGVTLTALTNAAEQIDAHYRDIPWDFKVNPDLSGKQKFH